MAAINYPSFDKMANQGCHNYVLPLGVKGVETPKNTPPSPIQLNGKRMVECKNMKDGWALVSPG